jgi:hypothetical protein
MDFSLDPLDLILWQTDRNLRLGHTDIIPRRFVLKAADSEGVSRHTHHAGIQATRSRSPVG